MARLGRELDRVGAAREAADRRGMMGYSVLVSTCTALQSIAIEEATSETWIWPGTVKREHWSGMYINWI